MGAISDYRILAQPVSLRYRLGLRLRKLESGRARLSHFDRRPKPAGSAFEDRSIRRGIIVAEGDYVACQTWMEGRFVREFTHSPVGILPPNGQRVVWDLMNLFRFDARGKLVEEWVRTDYRSFLRQLGARGQ